MHHMNSTIFKRIFFLVGILAGIVLVPFLVFGQEEKLIVQDATETKTFVVTEDGSVYTAGIYRTQKISPGFWLDETDYGKSAYFVLDGGVLQMQRRATNFGEYEAAPLKVRISAPNDSLNIQGNGYVGFGTFPSYPIHSSTGAYLSAAGVWVNSSSREYKENIQELSVDKAKGALKELYPITYTSKIDPEDNCAGFIAEDVPEIVATKDRKGLSPMDIVAVITKVVQEQQKTIEELSAEVKELRRELRLRDSLASIEAPLR